MKVSIVIAVLDSHKAVDRQLRYFAAMPLPEYAELILVDDGSNPPLKEFVDSLEHQPPRLRMLRQDIDAEWTQPAARNYGVREAKGEWLVLTDIDHIIPLSLIEAVAQDEYDWMMFQRQVGVLDEQGRFTQDKDVLFDYGYQEWRFQRNGYKIPRHVNSFGIRRSLYLSLGGVSEHRVGTGKYPNQEDGRLRRRLLRMSKEGRIRDCPEGDWPMIYMFPNGKYAGDVDYNPHGLFHTLTRKNPENRQWQMQQRGRFKP